MHKLKEFWQMVKETAHDWSADKVPRLGASLAYYSIFSLAPLLLIAIGLAGLIFGEQAARGEILGQLRTVVGNTAAEAIQQILESSSERRSGIIATVIGFVLLLFGASGVFVELQDSLNTIWKVMPRPGMGWIELIRVRLLSFLIILGTGLLLLVSLVASAVLQAVGTFLQPAAAHLPGGPWLWEAINGVVSFALLLLLLAMIYRVLPDADIAWRDVWVGALVSALLFTAGKYGIGVYLSHSSVTSAFGAAGSVVVLLVWVYYSAQILLFGAEFTRVYACHTGSRIQPSEHAVRMSPESLTHQGILDPAAAGDGSARSHAAR
jgi:membrane protein